MCALALLLVLALVLPAAAATVEGTVTLKSPLKKRAQGRKVKAIRYGQPKPGEYEPAMRDEGLDPSRSVVVYLVGVKGPGEGPFPPPRMIQQGRQFEPYVLPVRVGTAVEFPNRDLIYHGVYSDSPAKNFELPEYPRGQSRSVTFDKPGVVELFCAIHTHMNAYILVLENGYFGMPDAERRYRITGVPPGRYVLKAWHPRLDIPTRTIEVKEPGLTLDLVL
ncbi:MAG: hypothetical protein AB1758_03430 [Candidatus Eremiobacterota bacterium]